MNESPIFTRTYDLVRWLIPLTLKFPRQQRFVVAEALQRTALHFQECLIEAVSADRPDGLLKEADTLLTKLRLYLRLSRDLGCISLSQYAHAAELVTEIGRLLGGWQKSIRG
jgi:hypothetical protein